MHDIAQAIEEDGEYLVECPDCGFMFDMVAFYNTAAKGESIAELLIQSRRHPANTGQADV